MVYRIKLKNIKKYLEDNGWSIVDFNAKACKISKIIADQEISTMIPNNEAMPDYDIVLEKFIEFLASVGQRDAKNLAEEIENIGYDILQMRLLKGNSENGIIPLRNIGNAIKQMEDIIKFEACSEINTQSKYQRPYEEAQDLITNCQLAQTSVGSFIFNIRIPFGETYIEKIEEGQEYLKDLGRNTLIRLLSGIKEAKEEVNLTDESQFKANYDKKLNWNSSVSIVELIKDVKEAVLEINAKWNHAVPLSSPPTAITLTNADKTRFEKISTYLDTIPEEQEIKVSGEIKRLDRVGEETVMLYDDKLKRNIFIQLISSDYQRACDFHKNRISRISVEGILKKDGGKWVLSNYRNFGIEGQFLLS